MELTAFFPFFLVLLGISLRSPLHWLAATGFACFLQGASPFVLTAGGRLAGMAPAYLLTAVGLLHYLRERLRIGALAPDAVRGWSVPQLWLLLFTAIGVLGAIFLPRVFAGVVHAMGSRGSINEAAFTPVSPSGTNIIQAFYLVVNLMLFSIASYLVATREHGVRWALKGVACGLAFACLLGLYQLIAFYAGLPWPTEVINSNTGVGQFPDQMAGGIKRITSTFWEPSLLGYNFVGCLGLFLLGGRAPALGVLALCVLMLSTSSLGYFGLVALVAIWLVLDRRVAGGTKVRIGAAVASTCLAFIGIDYLWLDSQALNDLVLNKADSSSGVGRSTADALALQTFIESAGLGVGVGSTRASSFLATLLATTGLAGVLAFGAFAVTLVQACYRRADDESRQMCFALIGFLIVWVIAIPDLVQATFWLVAGVASGHLRREARIPVTDPAGAPACATH
jgi:hypothetical protein